MGFLLEERVIGKNYLESFQAVLHLISLSKHDLLAYAEGPLLHYLLD